MTGQRPLPFVDRLRQADSLQWPSLRAAKESAWHGHVAFAHWLVSEMRPSTVVELGSHNGVSYAAFCNALRRTGTAASCFAVDTWEGDPHAGFYGETVFQDLQTFNAQNFASFSKMLRCYFDDAVGQFADNSVDLLHIDGLHTYDAVKHDFETWLPKLSSRSVVLFHDTNVFERGFGVWQLWAELCRVYPGFQFLHSAGLGVLAVGPDIPPAIRDLCNQPRLDGEPAVLHEFVKASHLAHLSGLQLDGRDVGTGRNIALNCRAMQSSGLGGQSTPEGGVNGTKTGDYGFHTESEPDPWWMVDLGRARHVSRIVAYNRLTNDCAGRARNIRVMVSADGQAWTTVHRQNGVVFGGIDGNPLAVHCDRWNVRFVRFQLDGFEYLHLDEVEVYD